MPEKSCNTCIDNVTGHCTIGKLCSHYNQWQDRATAVSTCPHADTCAVARKHYDCFDPTFEGDEPCPRYINKSSMPTIVKQATYSVGDKLLVRADLTEGNTYGSDLVTPDMTKLAGQVVTVSSLGIRDKLSIKECGWNWTAEMFDGMLTTKED